jgi:uncharacterized protein (UPF0332 family)
MKEFIRAYKQNGLIREEKIGFDQVVKHLNRARKDLKVAKANIKIDSEASYNYAYLAMLRTGRGLMLSFGFRPIDGEQHKTVVAFCEYFLGSELSNLVKHFDRMRRKRNRFTYDEPGLLVSETETKKSFKDAAIFVEKVSNFIQSKNPQRNLM